jgi:nicotinate (nicotinamide) nucleotide adenylyltransferase
MDEKSTPSSHLVTKVCEMINQDLKSLRVSSSSKKVMDTKETSLAVFPGSFNPPTKVHVDIVKRVLEMKDVEALWVDMTVHRTKKTRIAEVLSHRTKMTRSAVRDVENAGVTTLMSQLGDDGWGPDYFRILQEVSGGYPVTWVMGSDVVRDMKYWREKARECILMCRKIVVFTRSHDEKEIRDMIRDVTRKDGEEDKTTQVTVMMLSKACETISSTKTRSHLIELSKKTKLSSLLLGKIVSNEEEKGTPDDLMRHLNELRRTTPESVLTYIADHPDLVCFYENMHRSKEDDGARTSSKEDGSTSCSSNNDTTSIKSLSAG